MLAFFVVVAVLFGIAAWCCSAKAGIKGVVRRILFTFGVGVVGSCVTWVFCGESVKVWLSDELTGIRTADSSSIKYIVMHPGKANRGASLVPVATRIDSSEQIALICQYLRDAERWSPNHPIAEWSVMLELCGEEGSNWCEVERTTNNGTLVNVWTDKAYGLLLGTYRAGRLSVLLMECSQASQAGLTDDS